MHKNRLWYKTFSEEYMSGLPIGTGRLAAMILGIPTQERIALNHEWGHTGWSRSWVACLFARLGKQAEAWDHLSHSELQQ